MWYYFYMDQDNTPLVPANNVAPQLDPKTIGLVTFVGLGILIIIVILARTRTIPENRVTSNPITSSQSATSSQTAIPGESSTTATSASNCSPYTDTLSYEQGKTANANLQLSFCKPASATITTDKEGATFPFWVVKLTDGTMKASIFTQYEVGISSFSEHTRSSITHSSFGNSERFCKDSGTNFECTYLNGQLSSTSCVDPTGSSIAAPCGESSVQLENGNDYFMFTCAGSSQIDLEKCDRLFQDLKVEPIAI